MFKRINLIHCLVWVTALVLVAGACKKSSGPNNNPPTAAPTVHILGTVGDTVKYWKNGAPATISVQHVLFFTPGSSSLFASGNNVYIAGDQFINNPAFYYSSTANYWRNGTPTTLFDSAGNAYAAAISVSGNDVYVAGITYYYMDTSHVPYTDTSVAYPKAGQIATVWKNGAPVSLQGFNTFGLVDSSKYAVRSYDDYVSGIYVSGNDVYVAGGSHFLGYNAMYWKNGTRVDLTKGLIYSDGNGNNRFPNTTSVYASGNDVYVTGFESPTQFFSMAIYWKNGVLNWLSTDSLGGGSRANSVVVAGKDVYIAGYQNINGYSKAILWKNGVATVLASSMPSSYANAVFVQGNDVYVAGFQWIAGGDYVATWWKNGVATTLTDGKTNAIATSIYVE